MNPAFAAARAAAQARLAVLGLPTNAAEAWRYVDVKPLASPPATVPRTVSAAEVAHHRLPGCTLVVLVDGAFQTDLSDAAPGVESLFALSPAEATALDQRWTRCAASADDLTSLWTLTDLAGGVRLRGTTTTPVQILALATGGCSGARLIIEAARGTSIDLILHHVALGPARASIGLELDLAEGASVRVDELQLDDTAQLFSLAWPRLGRDASLIWTSVGVGGQCVRSRSKGLLTGANASLSLAGLTVLAATRQAHQYLRVEHQVGDTGSQQVFKTIVDGKAVASFDGLVAIAKGADRSAAQQTNHNLLLSPGARADTRPQLDILADDVQAAHGATVGQINADELFYLRTRGLSEPTARALLIHGFAGEILEQLTNPAARALARRQILALLAVNHD